MTAFKALLNQPLDAASTLSPTHIFYLEKNTHFKRQHSSVYDLTSALLSTYQQTDGGVTDTFLDSVQRVHRANPATTPTWQVERENWYSDASLTVVGGNDGVVVAKMHAPTFSMGTTKITFPAALIASSTGADTDAGESIAQQQHEITLTPATMTTRAQGFVKESVPFLWASSLSPVADAAKKPDRGSFSLFRSHHSTGGGKKIGIARYQSFGGKYELGGMLVADSRVFPVGSNGMLTVVLTLVGLLGAKESFNRVSAQS
jgi:hypothetical protein